MDWYYSDGRQQFGPVTQAEFDALVASGRINASTLVWRAGMANWAAWGTVQPPAPAPAPVAPMQPAAPIQPMVSAQPEAAAWAPAPAQAQPQPQPQAQTRFCSNCGRPVAPGDLLTIGNMTVCANCKAGVMQRMREGSAQGAVAFQGRQYGGFWIRFVAVFIDGIIVGIPLGLIYGVLVVAMVGIGTASAANNNPTALFGLMALYGVFTLVAIGAQLFYESWFIVNKGATPGKMILSLEVIRADGTRPGWGLALGRYLAKILSGWILYIGYIMAGFDEEKRALHDRICNTRVVRK